MATENKKILVIGFDSAEWGVINPLIEAGVLPNFKKIIDNGTSGKIKTLSPSFSPMLWTSIATGKRAHKHGILNFIEPDPTNKKGIRPINSTSRKVKAIWNILHHKNKKSNVVGWWPSQPVEPINGIMISNTFQKAVGKKEEPWPVKPNSVHGIDEQKMAELRVHPSQIIEKMISIFVPKAHLVDQEKDDRLYTIQKMVAETLTIKNTSLYLLENTDWNFQAVYFNELDKLSHIFMNFHPPKLPTVNDEQFEIYYNVITAAYTLYDSILGEFLQKAGEDTNVVVLSDHGFLYDTRRMKKKPKVTADIAFDHNPFGFLAFHGPDFKNGETVNGATLLDITPTLLALLDLPIGKDMDGKPLLSIFNSPKEAAYIDSWEELPGDFGLHNKDIRTDPFSELEAMQQLIDLGYIEPLNASIEEEIEKVKNETHYNLSAVLVEAGETNEAIAILEELYAENVVDVRYNLDLMRLYTENGNTERARQILEMFKKVDLSNISDFDYLEGKILIKEGDRAEAILKFESALGRHPNFINLLLKYGYLCNQTYAFKKAEKALKHLLTIETENHRAMHGLAVLCNKTNRYNEAIDYSISALKLQNNFVHSHYQLGFAFYKVEEYEGAAEVLEACLLLNPSLSRARNILINIYKDHLKDQQKYSFHHKILEESRKGEITVVSGLPRSGTSLMMQMLKAGGLDILTDGNVEADESNPKGYYELDEIKSSLKDTSWMTKAEGKVVKVVAPLLSSMKLAYNLKIVYMERDLYEVVSSQNAMLARKNKTKIKDDQFDLRLLDTFKGIVKKSKQWMLTRNNVEVHFVSHRTLFENPKEEIKKINLFMDGQLNEEAMLKIIDPSLYRTKSDNLNPSI